MHNHRPETRSRFRDAWLFFRTFLKSPGQMSSVMPSSPEVIRRALADLPLDKATCIVELGAGTGPITAGIVSRINGHGTRVVVVESDARFCERLRSRFPEVEVVEGDAARLPQIVKEFKIDRVDHVISALPLFAWPETQRRAIAETVGRMLTPQGTFTQITAFPLSFFRRHFRRHFAKVSFRPVLKSLPPAGVFRCSNQIN